MASHYHIEAHDTEWHTFRGLVLPWGVERLATPDSLFLLVRLVGLVTQEHQVFTEEQFLKLIGLPKGDIRWALEHLSNAGFINPIPFIEPDEVSIRICKPSRQRPKGLGRAIFNVKHFLSSRHRYYRRIRSEKDWIYFMESKTTGWVKIGQSDHPNSRKAEIETALGEELEILLTQKNTGRLESQLHERFEEYRIRHPRHKRKGEWFERTPAIDRYIKKYSGRPDLAKEINR